GKLAMPAIPGESRPLCVTGTVKTIANGRFRNKGPMGRGVLTDMGPSVVLERAKPARQRPARLSVGDPDGRHDRTAGERPALSGSPAAPPRGAQGAAAGRGGQGRD